MAITEQNIQLLKPERLTDFVDGGGRMTGNAVVDGQVNELFPDISDLDRTIGRVSLKKGYVAVQTATTDTYLGAHVIVTDPPADTHVNITLFSTGSWTDERAAARNRIESYSIQGPESRWVLYGDHIIGQRTIRAYSVSNAGSATVGTGDPSPEAGDVLMLSTEKTGYIPNQQYFRITKLVSRSIQKFTDTQPGDFYKEVLVLELSAAMRYDFPGALMNRLSQHGSPTLIRTTQVADAAQYFGVKPLALAAASGDITVKVDTPYGVLVPSAQAETPIVDAVAGMTKANMVQAGAAATLTASAVLTGSVSPDYAASLYLGRGLLPGSLALTIGGAAYKDDGSGLIVGASANPVYAGTVDYSSGKLTVTKGGSWVASVVATATPAVAIYDNAHTASVKISINNRQYNYVRTLTPVPSPGTVSVDYRALGKWIRLTDNGLGQLVGPSGSGTVDYATGSVIATLGALPDVGSSVVYAWSTPTEYQLETGVLSPPPTQVRATLTHVPVQPGSVVVTWNDGVARTATADATGNFTGNATGHVVHASGEIVLQPTNIPASNAVFHVAYNQATAESHAIAATVDGVGVATLTLTNAPILAGSLLMSYITQYESAPPWNGNSLPVTVIRKYRDDGAGHLRDARGALVAGSTVNYTTGAVSLPTRIAHNFGANGTYFPAWTAQEQLANNANIACDYIRDTATITGYADDVALTALTVDLQVASANPLVANSVCFQFAGQTYIDRTGAVYRAQNPLTDSATLAGSLDYQTGIVSLNNWAAGGSAVNLLGLVATRGAVAVSEVYFRSPGSPLAPGSFFVRATDITGANITGQANANGDITGTYMVGTVDWDSGVASILFGHKVLDSSLSAAAKAGSWYNSANVDGQGYIFVPLQVKPETIRFDCVVVSFIPLDGDILGVDTVRLPQDGKVPIFRPGNVAVVHNTQTTILPNPVSANQVINLGRTRLAYARLYDNAGTIVPATEFSADLNAGTITMAASVNLTGLTQPLKCEHRIEDMALLSDVQITGHLTLLRALTHDFAAPGSYVSSALIIGDLQARVEHLFDQASWDGVYRDAVNGSGASASFNATLHPLELTNQGAIEERWALVFNGANAFSCYGEYSGLIAVGNTTTDFAPVNPETNTPYFTLRAAGWGGGWSAGNVLRFNTKGANYPLWLARTTLQGPPATATDKFKLQIRGNAN